jgi:hypothetical protein
MVRLRAYGGHDGGHVQTMNDSQSSGKLDCHNRGRHIIPSVEPQEV